MARDYETYRVKAGDTLSEIAKRHDTTVKILCADNDIINPNYIVEGQSIIITKPGASPLPKYPNNSSKVSIQAFGVQSQTLRTMYVSWKWDKSNTENYDVKWTYTTGDGVNFVGSHGTTEEKQSIYEAPDNAKTVSVVIKPISKKRNVNGKETSYWTASWSTAKKHAFEGKAPDTPSVPNVEIKNFQLTAKNENIKVEVEGEKSEVSVIQYQIVKDNEKVFKTATTKVETTYASYSCKVDAGGEYKVRCRTARDGIFSEWSDYSSNISTAPAASEGIISLRAQSSTSVYIEWSKVSTAESYEVQYTTQKRYFDGSPSEVNSTTVESVVNHAEITGLQTGTEWFFRVRAKNKEGDSSWTSIESIVLGRAPSIPTTWSSSTTVIVGNPLTLYWVHNAEDGSSQTYAQLELDINGEVTTHTIQNSTDEFEKDKTSVYPIDTSGYTEGTKIQWRVKTKGVLDSYSDWSAQRTIDIYAPPTLSVSMSDSEGNAVETLESFPFYISAETGPNTQTPIGFHISIVSNEYYETLDEVGVNKVVKSGDEVYSQHFDVDSIESMEFSASNIDLENNIPYTIKMTVSMNSGLTAEDSYDFTVSWLDAEYHPDAEIGYDEETLTAQIRPYCWDTAGNIVDSVTLSVYRREFDGRFTELATGLDNTRNTFITDPHPALDYARYRVVAISSETGAVSYYDVPGYPIGEKAVIIQWSEDWSNFDYMNDSEYAEPMWTGSLLKLPYNIDVADNYNADVSLIEYIGREHPVSYYGTQRGESSTWNVEIDKSDEETLYALRRLAIWMGDVYVREPSGSGYWANVKVSFSQNHCKVTIPVTLNITRVSGGM